VHTDGHTFGPGVNGKDEKVAKEAILKLIDEKTALLNTGAEQTNEQVNDKLGAFRFSVDDLKQALQSDVMGKDERAFIFTLFSDVVGSDEKLCGKLGISNERCKELRQESIDHFTSTLDAGVKALSDIIENEPKKLEKYLKLTDKEKEQVLSLSERIQSEEKNITELTNGSEFKAVEAIMANAVMKFNVKKEFGEEGEHKTFWQKLISLARSPKTKSDKAEGLEATGYEKAMPETNTDAVSRSGSPFDVDSHSHNRLDEENHSSSQDDSVDKNTTKPGTKWTAHKAHKDQEGAFVNKHARKESYAGLASR
jgi:hypothetical protein